jgi:hypothetical protein
MRRAFAPVERRSAMADVIPRNFRRNKDSRNDAYRIGRDAAQIAHIFDHALSVQVAGATAGAFAQRAAGISSLRRDEQGTPSKAQSTPNERPSLKGLRPAIARCCLPVQFGPCHCVTRSTPPAAPSLPSDRASRTPP